MKRFRIGIFGSGTPCAAGAEQILRYKRLIGTKES